MLTLILDFGTFSFMLQLFFISSAGIKKGQNYIFPRVAKNNRAVLPNCARGVTTYRKTFLEVHVLFCLINNKLSVPAVPEFWAVDVNKWCTFWPIYMCRLGTLDNQCKQQKNQFGYTGTFYFTFCSKVVFTWISPVKLVIKKNCPH